MLIPITVLIIAMSSIQLGASLAKGLFPLVGAAGASSLRLFFASLMLALIFRPWKERFSRKELLQLFFYGASLGGMNLAFFFAIQLIPLGPAVALEFTGPLAVAIFSSRKKVDFLWAFLAMAGILLLLPLRETTTTLDPLGVFFALLSGVFWGLYIIFGKKAGDVLHGGTAVTMGMIFAALCVLPFGLLTEGPRLFQLPALPLGLAIAVLGSALPYSMEMFSLKRMPARTFGVLMSLEPALGCLFGQVLLKESLTPLQFAAICCVVISSTGSSLTAQEA